MTQPASSRCVFTEGSICLPVGYREQTVNILVAPHAPSLNISRDILPPGEGFADYLSRQRMTLKKGLRKYEALDEQPAALGDGLIQGISLLSRYQPQKSQSIYQRQAVFPVSSGVLIFTLASTSPLTEQDETFFADCVSSYQYP
ncbi:MULTISPECIES: DUF1795 domain-containing protein [Yersinia pseudotuberculosis complex]|uniref:DUF1795 domain-containing protein n=2 Tax=Yersinia pseudotuberculosis complex TaxID=1649845 RepID=Q6EVP4_YERPU|nr:MULTISPECIES: DUF1795 domain-containing protein [Yersinia pseudotuberculosis complex]AYW90797.1 DUF1795 domain-containing protein [Yersinia pseudotuberculosis]KGA63332.1 hypothetical protein DJ55_1695 [Yersinia pseudotuberculosis]MBO1630617.1 DUF1795 domain-containing protein [Yersinia pseudotuberculosis]MBP0071871.1 DUF1795 domain-containing protein [Yersinia pseudotuberculosis]CAF28564.1 hypothetical protein [Yersinia pseudotuberculosis]